MFGGCIFFICLMIPRIFVPLLGLIYACGGFDGRNRQDSVERYDPVRNQWTHVQPMWRKRSDAGATTLDGERERERVMLTISLHGQTESKSDVSSPIKCNFRRYMY